MQLHWVLAQSPVLNPPPHTVLSTKSIKKVRFDEVHAINMQNYINAFVAAG